MKQRKINNQLFIIIIGFFVGLPLFIWYKSYRSYLHYVDFDESMQAQRYAHIINQGRRASIYEIFKRIYEKNNFLKIRPSQKIKIPLIAHFVWIQGNPPEKYQYIVDSWKKNNPDFELRLWTDKEIKQLRFLPHDLYDAAVNYGEKSDIAKYTIVYEHGGVYADITDEECLKPFKELHYLYDFYIGVQPLDTNNVQIGLGLFAAAPRHPLLKHVIDGLYQYHHIPQIVAKTGPLYFTQIFCSIIFNMPGINIVLPASYFYPRGYTQGPDKKEWKKTESLAVHHWAGSWLERDAFVH
jgi:mannosyltransferase OCH1-like enzyme